MLHERFRPNLEAASGLKGASRSSELKMPSRARVSVTMRFMARNTVGRVLRVVSAGAERRPPLTTCKEQLEALR